MTSKAIVGTLDSVKADAIVLFTYSDDKHRRRFLKDLSAQVPHVAPAVKLGDITGRATECRTLYCGSALASPRIIIAGLGDSSKSRINTFRNAAGAATKAAAAIGATAVGYIAPSSTKFDFPEIGQAILEGSMLSQYRYDKYKTSSKSTETLADTFLLVCSKELHKEASSAASVVNAVAMGTCIARDLANAPNCELYPEVLGKRAVEIGRKEGVKVTVLSKRRIEALRMGGLLGVNKGSVRPPVFIVMEYNGGKVGAPPIVLVGKGVTFDTGGISLKPGAGMSDMRGDMHGAATVIGTIAALARLKVKRNIVALIPATENMPSGSAIVPGDILTFMNGKTAEIDNTDAEGRLILADALCYADRYKPEAVIDVATLTGAVVIALGHVTIGMMGNDDRIIEKLQDSGNRTSEFVCRLPLHQEYEELISSDYADIKNSGGRSAGSITAALFLQHFVSYPWVHLDIAGTAMLPKATHYNPKGMSGVGVRLLSNAVLNW